MTKQVYQSNCATYGVASCREYLGLTCAVGPGNYLQCTCKTGYYYSGNTVTGSCQGLVYTYSSCAGNTAYACNSALGLYCNTVTNLCTCKCYLTGCLLYLQLPYMYVHSLSSSTYNKIPLTRSIRKFKGVLEHTKRI